MGKITDVRPEGSEIIGKVEITRSDLTDIVNVIKSTLSAFSNIEDSEEMIRFCKHLESENDISRTMREAIQDRLKSEEKYYINGEFTKEGGKKLYIETLEVEKKKITIEYKKFDPDYKRKLPAQMAGVLYLFYDLFNN